MHSAYFDFKSSSVPTETLTLRHQQPASGAGQQSNVLPQDSQVNVRWPLSAFMMRLVVPQVRGWGILKLGQNFEPGFQV